MSQPWKAGATVLVWLVPAMARAQSADDAAPSAVAVGAPAASANARAEARAFRVDVHFTTAEPGLTVYSRPVPPERLTGETSHELPEFRAVCRAPCDAALDRSLHEFALAPAGSSPIPVAKAFELRTDARLRGDVISHASERRAGWWMLGLMGGVGVTSTTIGLMQTCVDDQNCQEWTSLAIWSGIALTTAGALLGIPKIVKSDEATLTLVLGTAALAEPASLQALAADRSAPIPGGATLAGRF